MTPQNTQEVVAARLTDPSVHRWLKDALRVNLERDILDALYDVDELRRILIMRYAEITGRDYR